MIRELRTWKASGCQHAFEEAPPVGRSRGSDAANCGYQEIGASVVKPDVRGVASTYVEPDPAPIAELDALPAGAVAQFISEAALPLALLLPAGCANSVCGQLKGTRLQPLQARPPFRGVRAEKSDAAFETKPQRVFLIGEKPLNGAELVFGRRISLAGFVHLVDAAWCFERTPDGSVV